MNGKMRGQSAFAGPAFARRERNYVHRCSPTHWLKGKLRRRPIAAVFCSASFERLDEQLPYVFVVQLSQFPKCGKLGKIPLDAMQGR